MGRPDGLVTLPNGQHIYYIDETHSYWAAREENGEWKKSRRLTGCSTLAKPFNYDSGRLLAWKEKVTCEGIASLVAADRDAVKEHGSPNFPWLASGDSIRTRLRLEGSDADSVRDRKATLGTNVHRVLEGLAGVCDLPNVDDMPEEEKGYARAVFRWFEYRRPEVLNAEQFVYSETHGYAGRFDLRCGYAYELADGDVFEGVALLDLKTSSFIGPSYHVQLALYELAARECGVGESHQQFVLQVKPDGTWREIPCQATEQDALAAIAVYRGVARIEREARAA